MTKQFRFPAMRCIKPPKPTIRTEHVALRIAKRIAKLVNGDLDDNGDGFHWNAAEITNCTWDIQQEIMRVGRPATVITRLYMRQPLLDDHPSGEPYRSGHPWGWDGIDADCRAFGNAIGFEELKAARTAYAKRYG